MPTDDIDEIDREALERCLAIACEDEPYRLERLKSDPWLEVAEAAAYHCQYESMNLRPWDFPPCWSDVDGTGPAGDIVRRLKAAGLSRFEPDPLAALEAKRRRRRK